MSRPSFLTADHTSRNLGDQQASAWNDRYSQGKNEDDGVLHIPVSLYNKAEEARYLR